MPGANRNAHRGNPAHFERVVLAKCMGLLARRRGQPAADNPFAPGTTYSTSWGSGFTAPDTKREKNHG